MSEGHTIWMMDERSIKEHPPNTKRISSGLSGILLDELPMKSIKEHPPDLDKTSQTLIQGPSSIQNRYTLLDGYLTKDNRLSIPRTSLRFLVWETHAGVVRIPGSRRNSNQFNSRQVPYG